MDEIFKSIGQWLKERTSNPLYFTFLLFFVSWNWQLFHILFFEEALNLKVPKIEYLRTLDVQLNLNITPWLESTTNWLANVLWRIGPPLIFTYFATIYLPKVHRWAHEIYVKNYFDRKTLYEMENIKYEKSHTAMLINKAQEKKEQRIQKENIEQSLTPEEKRDEQISKIISSQKNIDAIQTAYRAVYRTRGAFTTDSQIGALRNDRTYISHDELARLHTLDIIAFSGETGIAFTEFGMHILRKLQEKEIL